MAAEAGTKNAPRPASSSRSPASASGTSSHQWKSSTESMREKLASLPAAATRRFPPHPLSTEEQIEQLAEINEELQMQLSKALDGKLDVLELIKENAMYKRKLDELNTYIDQIDVEAEQEFGNLSEDIEHLSQMVEDKSKQVAFYEQQFREKDGEIETLKKSLEAAKSSSSRHMEIIETLRDELDAAREQNNERVMAFDRMQADMQAIKQQQASDREDFRKKELLLSCDLEDIQRQLNVQKDILQSNGVRDIIDKWDARIMRLENEIRERDSIIFTQQHLINEIRKAGKRSPADPSHQQQNTSLSSVNSRSH